MAKQITLTTALMITHVVLTSLSFFGCFYFMPQEGGDAAVRSVLDVIFWANAGLAVVGLVFVWFGEECGYIDNDWQPALSCKER